MKKMLKFPCIALAMLLLVSSLLMTGCNKGLDNVSEDAKYLGQRALTITDKYLDYEISNSTADDELDGIYSRLDNLDSDLTGDFMIKLDVSGIQSALLSERAGLDSGRKVLEARNELAEDLGESTRN